jgi:hypothetical protein
MNIKTKIIIILVVVCVVDVLIPIPILGLTLIYIVRQRPPVVMTFMREIYNAE